MPSVLFYIVKRSQNKEKPLIDTVKRMLNRVIIQSASRITNKMLQKQIRSFNSCSYQTTEWEKCNLYVFDFGKDAGSRFAIQKWLNFLVIFMLYSKLKKKLTPIEVSMFEHQMWTKKSLAGPV